MSGVRCACVPGATAVWCIRARYVHNDPNDECVCVCHSGASDDDDTEPAP